MATTIERAITDDLGLDVTVVVRTPAQLRRVVASNPFVRSGDDPKSLHVTFLAAAPAKNAVGVLDGHAFAPDEFRVHGQEVYVSCPNGYGRTKINNTWFERKLGVAATTRNWKTVTQLAELAACLNAQTIRGRDGGAAAMASASERSMSTRHDE